MLPSPYIAQIMNIRRAIVIASTILLIAGGSILLAKSGSILMAIDKFDDRINQKVVEWLFAGRSV